MSRPDGSRYRQDPIHPSCRFHSLGTLQQSAVLQTRSQMCEMRQDSNFEDSPPGDVHRIGSPETHSREARNVDCFPITV